MSQENPIDTGARETVNGLGAFFGVPGPATIFSEPLQAGDDVVITAAAWERVGGFGFGGGYGTEGDNADSAHGGGSGGGGGGVSEGRPVAVIRIGPDGVEVRPILDFTKIGVTVLVSLLAAWRAMRS